MLGQGRLNADGYESVWVRAVCASMMRSMNVTKADLDHAVASGMISAQQAEGLWALWNDRGGVRPRFDLVHVAYYFGALIVLGAMGRFMTLGWEQFGGGGIFAIACAYAAAFVLAGRTLWHKMHLKIPGGLLVTMAVGMTPLAIYGLERALGLWPDADPGAYRGFHEWIKGGWFAMELATIAAGLVAIRAFRFPFITFIIALTLWYMSMDVAPLVLGPDPSWNERAIVSVAVGIAVLVAAYVIDRRTREDFAFWLYIFGLLAFWGGLTSMQGGTPLTRLGYCGVNLILIVVSVLLRRRAFMVFGAMGVMVYLGYLAYDVFEDSLLFPFALSLIGIGVIAAGVHYHKRREHYERALTALIPPRWRKLLPAERGVGSFERDAAARPSAGAARSSPLDLPRS